MTKYLLLVLVMIAVDSFGQSSDISKIGLYKWNESILMQPCDIIGNSLNGEIGIPIASKIGQKFRLLKIGGDSAVIQILDYNIISSKAQVMYRILGLNRGKGRKRRAALAIREFLFNPDFYKYNFIGDTASFKALTPAEISSRTYGSKQRYFKVKMIFIDALSTKDTRIGGALAAGVINFPFKYRSQASNSDFSGAFNFGAGIGYTFPHRKRQNFTYSILSGYSISNIVLDSSNVNKNQRKLASINNFTAFSFSLGFLVEYQRVQAGVFLGWDRLSKLNQREFDWQYQGRPWVSVGFGIAIFSGQKEKAEKNASGVQ